MGKRVTKLGGDKITPQTDLSDLGVSRTTADIDDPGAARITAEATDRKSVV